MAHYSIYIPGAKGATNEHLVRVGLGRLCEPSGPEWTEVLGRGPDGGSGSVASWPLTGDPSIDALQGYHPERQQWLPIDEDPAQQLAAGRFWYGCEPERPPTPADLALKKQVVGERVLLADGQAWMIPFASRLPHDHALVGGKWRRRVSARHRDWHLRAQRNMEAIFTALDLQDFLAGRVAADQLSETPMKITLADGAAFCCDGLAINYRVTPEIVSFLALLDDRSMVAIIWTTIEMQAVLEVRDQKKTEYVGIPVGLNSSNGR